MYYAWPARSGRQWNRRVYTCGHNREHSQNNKRGSTFSGGLMARCWTKNVRESCQFSTLPMVYDYSCKLLPLAVVRMPNVALNAPHCVYTTEVFLKLQSWNQFSFCRRSGIYTAMKTAPNIWKQAPEWKVLKTLSLNKERHFRWLVAHAQCSSRWGERAAINNYFQQPVCCYFC